MKKKIRFEKFENLKTNAWYKTVYAKLSVQEKLFCEVFIRDNYKLDTVSFRRKINYLFINGEPKPLRWKEITELLTCVA